MVDFNASDADRVTAKIVDGYSLLPPQFIQKEHPTLPDYYLSFSCVSDAGDPSLSIFTLLEPYDASSPPYIEFKWI